MYNGVDFRIDRRRPCERLVQQLARADLALLHELREAKRVVADVFLEGHAGLRQRPERTRSRGGGF
jgi:hypothetical protein